MTTSSSSEPSTMATLFPNFRDQEVQSAVKNLLTYSLVILIVPLASMFLLKQFFFEGLLGVSANDALTYSAIIAVVLVHVVLGIWLFAATKQEDRKKRENKQD
ncbi:Vacuolar ATPase assembly integral membrane protein VMA21 homolog [Caenorhabditis elegans]|uniref:Vacuolar ATPase assembly integral membrane protein VMA21 homolog n=1 Tax=Caenorhabditis elegans TaxID=6239 RepID=VMA21_CAEEL|nr:Vacuolar ATPase assembly integral membrane protein VMA21 homolog [Caenorhabditis elegans]A5JYQ9.1 RecName: Full=Vacuolar ATPase assembly integral membrane protein VMA21 homolog [Caenorhabditis elegans]CAN86606.1 Vacuolar ATPase assembly integral membrane protein VMA21 homolog [Caenorhabditis elegans]|eukprot:NP_497897.1 Vacuolar ATPase assembly integral membrane protein VMA21 homolog [Caenorhabditis elegans]